jgi:hypothetical protein
VALGAEPAQRCLRSMHGAEQSPDLGRGACSNGAGRSTPALLSQTSMQPKRATARPASRWRHR